MIALLLAVVAPLGPDKLLVAAALIVLVVAVAAYFDEKAEIARLRDELRRDRRRRTLLRVIDSRRWR